MQQLFHENYEHNRKGYIQDLHNSKIHAAITLHPNKRPAYQYRLHNYMLSRKISELRYRTIQLHRESALMSKLSNSEVSKEDQQLGVMPSFNHFQPRERNDVIEWEFLTGKLLYSAAENQPPRQSINSILRTALDDTVLQVMEMINENAKSRGRLIDFKEIQYGYRRVDPMHGVEYILDLLLLYKRHKGRKLTVPVRRHAYLQQLFSKPFFREMEELDVNSLVESINSGTQSFSFISNSLKILSSLQEAKEIGWHKEKKVHILVPLTGRYDIFLRFMENFESTCLIPKQNVKLVIILFSGDSGQESNKHIELIHEYQNRYPNAEMMLIPMKGEFSRGLGLEMAASQFDNDTLLLFCDVDLIFRGDFLQRCRDNTIQGQQVYFPIIFSQYDPKHLFDEAYLIMVDDLLYVFLNLLCRIQYRVLSVMPLKRHQHKILLSSILLILVSLKFLLSMSAYMVDCIDGFSYVEPSLHPWDEAYLIMVDDFSDVFLELICQYFIEKIASIFMRDIGL
ncbi:chondroitin sulfate synthase 3 [Cricetulus griseus]|nr:chondroitin sulfate synthase 3 [Cricetulus griseus]